MKPQIIPAFLLVCLVSCTHNEVTKVKENPAHPPLREVQYNFATGEKIGETVFTYDEQRNLINEKRTSITNSATQEINYEYDRYNQLISEEESRRQYKTLYFYTGNVIDSTQTFYYSDIENKYVLNVTYLYEHDDQQRLTRKRFADGSESGQTIYEYNSNQLSSSCYFMDIYGIIRERCKDNEYNNAGQISRVYERSEMESPPVAHRLWEEYFYKGDLLDEKRVYEYPGHGWNNDIFIIQMMYEY